MKWLAGFARTYKLSFFPLSKFVLGYTYLAYSCRSSQVAWLAVPMKMEEALSKSCFVALLRICDIALLHAPETSVIFRLKCDPVCTEFWHLFDHFGNICHLIAQVEISWVLLYVCQMHELSQDRVNTTATTLVRELVDSFDTGSTWYNTKVILDVLNTVHNSIRELVYAELFGHVKEGPQIVHILIAAILVI